MSSARSFPSSPHSLALPSPPHSPLPTMLSTPADSIPPSPASSLSSFPSITSSFFDLSAAPSPPHLTLPLSSHEHPDSSQTLVIPSLTLPEPRQQTTIHGEVLGNLSILIVGRHGAGKTVLAGMLLDGNEDIVDPPRWSDNVLSASTTWSDETGSGMTNVRLIEMPGFDEEDGDLASILAPILEAIQEPFRAVSPLLNSNVTTPLIPLLTSPQTNLHTALIFLLSSPPTSLELSLLSSLSPHIPVLPLPNFPSLSRHGRPTSPRISTFRPQNSIQLRAGLFRTPRTLATLRREAAERFLRWRQASHGARDVLPDSPFRHATLTAESLARFEWDIDLSRDVAESKKELNESSEAKDDEDSIHRHHGPGLDPLHLPSLLALSFSLLRPLRRRIFTIFVGTPSSGVRKSAGGGSGIWRLGVMFTLGFCAGLGLGILLVV